MNTINYKKDFLCTYHLLEADEDDNEDDIKGYQDDLYKIQLLQAFNVKNIGKISDMTKIQEFMNDTILLLYEKYKNHNQIKSILNKHSYSSYTNDKKIIFSLLFSFDSFYMFHACIIDLERSQTIHPDRFSKIKEIVSMTS